MPPVIAAQRPALSLVKTLVLNRESDGVDGKLELLEDARLTPAIRKTLWQVGDPTVAFGEDSAQTRALATPPLLHAVLRLRDGSGKTLFEKKLKRELAQIEFESIHPGQRTIFVTTDLSIGFGSYAGPSTELLEVSGQRLEAVTARGPKTGEVDPIEVMRSLKTEWKLAPASANQPGQRDILSLACRPKDWGSTTTDFVRIYVRYHWNGTEWVLFGRRVPGIWEAGDDPFPASEKFPGSTSLAGK
jgi:hypothetical protein